ncbi:MAG: hypothetical protein KKF06_08160 [Candidatus Margulisbacteria bacterium]|nr:hypothetical protein [Candidatus Margulisiibacteriota bacterium]
MKIQNKPPSTRPRLTPVINRAIDRAAARLFPDAGQFHPKRPIPAGGPFDRLNIPVVKMTGEDEWSGSFQLAGSQTKFAEDLFTFFSQNQPQANLGRLKKALEFSDLNGSLPNKALGIELLMSWGASPDSVAAFIVLDTPLALLKENNFDSTLLNIIAKVEFLSRFTFNQDHGIKQGGLFIKMLTELEEDVDIMLLVTAQIFSELAFHAGKGIHPLSSYATQAFSPFLKVLHFSAHAKQLDDLAFLSSDPDRYEKIASSTYSGAYQVGPIHLSDELRTVATLLAEELNSFTFSWRLKGLWSIANKPRAVHDLLGISCITACPDECYTAVNSLTEIMNKLGYKWQPEKYTDYIKFPRGKDLKVFSNDNEQYYQALHCAFMNEEGTEVEIQVRSAEMERKALVGACSHISYKLAQFGFEGFCLDAPTARAIYEATHFDLQSKGYAYVYDDNGKLYDVGPKKGAARVTVLDFAFRKSAVFGSRVIGGIIRRPLSDGSITEKTVGLDSPVESGDTISLILSKEVQPINRVRYDAARTQLAASSLELLAAGVTDFSLLSLNRYSTSGKKAFGELVKQWEAEIFDIFDRACPVNCENTRKIHYSRARLTNQAGFHDEETFYAALGLNKGTENLILKRTSRMLQEASVVTGWKGKTIYVLFNNNYRGALVRLFTFLAATSSRVDSFNLHTSEGAYSLAEFSLGSLDQQIADNFTGRLINLYKHTSASNPFPTRRQQIEIKLRISPKELAMAVESVISLGENIASFTTKEKFLSSGLEITVVVLSSASPGHIESRLKKQSNGQIKRIKLRTVV